MKVKVKVKVKVYYCSKVRMEMIDCHMVRVEDVWEHGQELEVKDHEGWRV